MLRLWVWIVKSIVGVAQFAVLNRVAERTGLRSAWLLPVARALSPMTGLNENLLEILLLATVTCWLVWLFSSLCSCLTASLGRVNCAGGFSAPGPLSGRPRG
ncbi:MAG: hypothetical protein LAP40_22000 [Acidobacteriia bacterium]|nr:hypothetical protein [Terriglobia bacterium]